jgi:chromosome segregation ATPase
MSEDDDTKVLFMGIETQTDTTEDNNYENEEIPEVEGEVDLEGELISALEELRRYRRKNKSLKEQLLDYKEEQKSREEEVSKSIKKTEQIIVDLKTQLQEAKRIEEILSKRLNDKEQNCEKLEAEIVLLRRKLEKGTNLSKFESSSKILDDILNSQRPSSNKVGLGYDHKETNKGLKYEIQKVIKIQRLMQLPFRAPSKEKRTR